VTRRQRTRWDEDNELALNPWAFLAVALIIGAIVAPIVLVSVLD
jgi:hypothetical protein